MSILSARLVCTAALSLGMNELADGIIRSHSTMKQPYIWQCGVDM